MELSALESGKKIEQLQKEWENLSDEEKKGKNILKEMDDDTILEKKEEKNRKK